MNSLKIFKLTKQQDAPFIESIIESVNTLIEVNVENNVMEFNFDFLSIVIDLKKEQINRINDEVIKYFRANGIRISMSGEYVYDTLLESHIDLDIEGYASEYSIYFPTSYIPELHPASYYKSYNYLNRPNHIVNIKLFTRLSREYMKSYI